MAATVVTTFASTLGMAWLVDSGRTEYYFDEVQLDGSANLALNSTDADSHVSYCSIVPVFTFLFFHVI